MLGEETCQVCVTGNREARPPDIQYRLREVEQIEFTGPAEVLRQDQVRDKVLEGYERDLEVMSGSCLAKKSITTLLNLYLGLLVLFLSSYCFGYVVSAILTSYGL